MLSASKKGGIMRTVSVLSFLLILAILGCAPAQAPAPEIDLDAERAALMETDEALAAAYAASESPADTFVESATDGVRVLAPDAPLADGKEAVRGLFTQLESMEGFSINWSPTSAEVSDGADLGYTIGTYQMIVPGPEGGLVQIDGKYTTIWKKQADGAWKIAVDMFNANAPPTPVTES